MSYTSVEFKTGEKLMEGDISKGRGWHRISDEKRMAIVEEYKAGTSLNELAAKHGVTWLSAKNIVVKAGISIRSKAGEIIKKGMKLPPTVQQDILTKYSSGASSNVLADEYKVSQTVISRIIRRAGITRPISITHRQYVLDESVFDVLTDEGAYWIGMLMTDGSVQETAKHSPAISLTLQERDRVHLEKLAKFLKTDRVPIEVGSSGNTSHLPNKYFRLQFRSKKLVDALAKFGVMSNKTHRTAAGELKENLHFWRGVIDGDGGIADGGSASRLKLYLSGTENLLGEFCRYSLAISPNSGATVRSAGHSKAFQFHLTGLHAARVIRHLYDDASIYLDRKMETARKVIEDPKYDLAQMEERSALFNHEVISCKLTFCPDCGEEIAHRTAEDQR